MAEETWKIDVDEMTLNDLEALQKGMVDRRNAAEIKQLLGRLVTNKTAEEIGSIPLRELRVRLDHLSQTIDELSIPKENATP